jgi:ribosomal protein S18 acetylase RimI-like enzyme
LSAIYSPACGEPMTVSTTPRPASTAVIAPETLPEAARLLASAFVDDPLMRYLFGDHGVAYQFALHLFFSYLLDQRRRQRALPIGCVSGSRLVGLASISEPADEDLEVAWDPPAFLGSGAAARLDHYNRVVDSFSPRQSHVYLGVLGVHPRAQGLGYGRALLEAVQERSARHPRSTGVYLETTRPDNVALYERFGYRVVGHERLGELRAWCLFRPNN